MSLGETNTPAIKWFGKMPSGITLAGLLGIMAWAIWNGAKLQDQVSRNAEELTIVQVRFDALEKLVNANGSSMERLSFRMTAGDDRATQLAASLTVMGSEIHQLGISMAQVQVLLQARLPARPEERKP